MGLLMDTARACRYLISQIAVIDLVIAKLSVLWYRNHILGVSVRHSLKTLRLDHCCC
jgi:hypothetical protein